MVLAGHSILLRRIIGFMIDLMVINIFILAGFRGLMFALIPGAGVGEMMASYNQMISDPGMMGLLTMVTILMSLFILAYFSLSEYMAGTTIGLYFVRLGVTQDGETPTLFRSLVRNAYCIPFFPFIVLWIIEPFYLIIFGERLTERLTKTKTVVI